MQKTALYVGTFDPITLGHFDIISRASAMFDTLIVGVAYSKEKNTLFSIQQRVSFIEKSLTKFSNIKVVSYANLTVDLAKEHGATLLIRGLRDSEDFEYERRLEQLNKTIDEQLETLYLLSRPEHTHISSSSVRALLKFNAPTKKLLPDAVEKIIKEEYRCI